MNKKVVEDLIPKAVVAIKNVGIVKNNSIQKTFRGQISTFGAAISGGSLLAAIAFFSNQGSATVERQNLLKAIYILVVPEKEQNESQKELFGYVKKEIDKGNEEECKENILNAAIAIKLAMNVFELK